MSCPVANLGRATLYNGDCLDVMRELPDGIADSICTDPPAGIHFMSAAFDSDRGGRDQWVAWLAERLAEARRVIRPGGFMLCWAIPRTSHWTAMAIEQAGWTIRDRISNLMSGSDVMDRFVETLSGDQKQAFEMVLETISPSRLSHCFGSGFPKSKSCIKPSVEDWWLCKAPGKLLPLQIKRSLIGGAPPSVPQPLGGTGDVYGFKNGVGRSGEMSQSEGRWPANLCLSHSSACTEIGSHVLRGDHRGDPGDRRDGGFFGVGSENGSGEPNARVYGNEIVTTWECVEGCPVLELGRQSGQQKSVRAVPHGTNPNPMDWGGKRKDDEKVFGFGDSGTAARFFATFAPDKEPDEFRFKYQAKCSRSDRSEGLEGLETQESPVFDERPSGDFATRMNRVRPKVVKSNTHPTVKSTHLMQWLCRLITPEGGTVLDPFCGSGSTGKACIREGFRFVGIESDVENGYFEIARRRIEHEIKKVEGDMPLFQGLNA